MNLFLRWALVNVVFGCTLAAAALAYNGTIHPAGKVAAVAVLCLYAMASAYAGRCAHAGRPRDAIPVLKLFETLCPLGGMVGGIAGLMIAYNTPDNAATQHAGKLSGLAGTLTGVTCLFVLSVLLFLFRRAR